jgi:multisubunit Na+/H+ antiporter MnhG subunit
VSPLGADIIIYLLLITGVGFSGLGVIGLLLFPDIRSRRYTAFRASLIGFTATGSAVIIYGVYQFSASNRNVYLTLVLHALILVILVFAANMVISREILERAIPKNSCEVPGPEKPGDTTQKT